MNRRAGVCSLVLGLGFGLPGVYGAWYYARQGQVWTFLGSRRTATDLRALGIPDQRRAAARFRGRVRAEVVEVSCSGRVHDRPVAGVALLPVELLFWIGFALPFGPLLGLARTALVVAILLV